MSVVDRYTKSLLHFNGLDESTTFIDETGVVWTPSEAAKLDNANVKFGNTSGYFVIGRIMAPHQNPAWDLYTTYFEIDFWIRLLAFGETKPIVTKMDPSASGLNNFWIGTYATGGQSYIRWKIWTDPDPNSPYDPVIYTKTHQTAIPRDAAFHHVACIQGSLGWSLYFDGVKDLDAMHPGLSIRNDYIPMNPIYIGGSYDGQYCRAWIDEFRLSVGNIRWHGATFNANPDSFTPPTKQYTEFHPRVLMIG
jgi:hypothetical protein